MDPNPNLHFSRMHILFNAQDRPTCPSPAHLTPTLRPSRQGLCLSQALLSPHPTGLGLHIQEPIPESVQCGVNSAGLGRPHPAQPKEDLVLAWHLGGNL